MIKKKNVWLLGLLVSLAFAASIYAQGYGDETEMIDTEGDGRTLETRTWMAARITTISALAAQTESCAPFNCV